MSSLGRIRSVELLLSLKDAILCEPVFSFPTCVSSVVIIYQATFRDQNDREQSPLLYIHIKSSPYVLSQPHRTNNPNKDSWTPNRASDFRCQIPVFSDDCYYYFYCYYCHLYHVMTCTDCHPVGWAILAC
jgi:hypothetical protein